MAHDHHHHHHGHHHHHHGHGHGLLDHNHDGDRLAVLNEEPLDPANQSLSDALKASFGVLKIIMVVLVVLFLFSGVFIVNQNEVAVVSAFGKQVGTPREAGLHFAWPFPIGEVVKIPTSDRLLMVDAFWLKLSDADKAKDLSELNARGTSLDPAIDGALLTGDKALMHMLTKVQYRIQDALSFVVNVGPNGEERLLRSVVQSAAVAEAARTRADVVWKDPKSVADRVQARAQAELDRLEAGILLVSVLAEKSHYPLQVKDAFLDVTNAANVKRQLINDAQKAWAETLNKAAGPAWKELNDEISKLDKLEDGAERDQVMRRIEELLVTRASGEAGRKIQLAQGESQRIVEDARARENQFKMLLAEYRENRDLLRARMLQNMLAELYAKPGVTKWVLPPGENRIDLIMNQDPLQIKEREREAMQKRVGGGH